MVRKAIPPSMCPDCYMHLQEDTPLNPPRPGAVTSCPKGHMWEDMEELDRRMALAKVKREAVNPTEPVAPLVDKEPEPFAAPRGNEVVISLTDKDRLSTILGPFGDSATLYGRVWSMQNDMDGLKEQLAALQMKAMQQASAPERPTSDRIVQSGDMSVTVIIPERHVIPIQDIAAANGTDMATYVNSIVEMGADSGWFF